MTVDGIASAAPVPQPVPRPAATSSPGTTPIPVPAPGTTTGVYAEWVADGWIPRPLLPVTEPDSGVTAWMFGTAEQQPGGPDGGTSYRSVDAPASVVTWFAVFPVPEGYVADAEQGAVNTAIARDDRVLQQVHQIMVDRFTVPST